MRHLTVLFACSLVTLTASAADTPPARSLGGVEASSAVTAKAGAAIADAAKDAAKSGEALKGRLAAQSSARSRSGPSDDAEIDLSARIAARLAEMRAVQAERAAQAARARKAAAAAAAAAERQAAAAAYAASLHATHWSYEGEYGPANWSRINPNWAKCASGTRQSPIDIRDGMKVDLDQISFDYRPSSFSVVDNGHTIQVTPSSGNYITIQNRMYELMQFHFHRPSEERINGKGFEMVVHLVHRDAEGKFAVLAILLERGKQQSAIQTVWNNLPLEKNEVVQPSIVLDPLDLLPVKREYYTYMGSLTTPPCTEGVLWLVMKEPVQASPAQMALFSRLYPLNARPIQASSGRIIKESN